MPNMKEWTRLVEKVETFSKLRELSLCDCDKLAGDFPWLLPSLTKLSISRSLQLASSLPRTPVMSKLKLGNCDNPIRVTGSHVVKAFGCLQHLKISYYSFPMTFSCCENVELVMHLSHQSLEQLYVYISCTSILLEIERCENLALSMLYGLNMSKA